MINASVIISTRNRALILPRLFNALAKLEVDPEHNWELILLDNGSTDITPEIIEAERQRNRLPIIPLSAPVSGKSRALNIGIQHARGELIILTDDDVEPDPKWLSSYIKTSIKHPKINGFAGKVIPKWLGKIPNWLHTEGEFALPRGIINSRDFGNEIHILPKNITPGGVNTALRKTALLATGAFREDIGPGTLVPFAEDTEFMERYKNQGGTFLYIPEALLYHCNEPARMTKSYVTHWMYEVARCQVIAFKTNENYNNKFRNIPAYLLRQAIERTLLWIFEPRQNNRLQKKMKLFHTLGRIKGHMNNP